MNLFASHLRQRSYEYDDQGNQFKTGVEMRVFNAFGLPKETSDAGGTSSFDHDAYFNRVLANFPAGESEIQVPGLMSVHYQGFDRKYRLLVSAPTGMFAQIEVTRGSTSKETVGFVVNDSLNSLSLVTDSSASVVSRPRFEPFGALAFSHSMTRIRHLEGEIRNFQQQLERLRSGSVEP